jgi:Domain of unknown function (DUF5615)
MARLYANENFPFPVVAELRRLGHDVVTVQETGKAEQAWPDEDVLAFARDEGRALLTLNRKHFVRLHSKSATHAGIIACTVDSDFIRQAERIHDTLSGCDSLDGKLLRVNRPN